jgi:tetratricopeptide (TPR) repeat protein
MRRAPRRDRRLAAVTLTLLAIALGGWALQRAMAPPAAQGVAAEAASDPHAQRVQRLFDAAVLMLHAKRHEEAATALHQVLRLAPALPEAHVNMGFALLGLGRAREAGDFFGSAIALRAGQANAYYGLALAHEAQHDHAAAIGAMRSYLHLARRESDAHLRRARAALWEWESARTVPEAGKAAPPAPRAALR